MNGHLCARDGLRTDLRSDGLSLLCRWRLVVASALGPTDYVLSLGGRRTKNVGGVLQRAVAHVLATHMDALGRCYPSMETIGIETGCSERGARYAVRALQGRVVARSGDRGKPARQPPVLELVLSDVPAARTGGTRGD
jgi:hypothetical protein